MNEHIHREKRKFDVNSFNRRIDASIPLLVKGVTRTRQRLFVYSIFQKADKPMTAADIICLVQISEKNINQATVYRILLEFKKCRLIEKVGKVSTIAGDINSKRNCYQIM